MSSSSLLDQITLPRDPTASSEAATKNYVDAKTTKILYANGQVSQLTNSTSLTTLETVNIPGGTLGDGSASAVHVRIIGRYRNNNGGATASTLRIQFAYGGQTLWDGTTTALTAGTGVHAFAADLILQGSGATNAQNFGGMMIMSSASAPTTGTGGISVIPAAATGFIAAINNGTSATVDSTANQNFTVAAQHSVGNALTNFFIDSIVVEMKN